MSEQNLQSQITNLQQAFRRHTHDGFETQKLATTTSSGVTNVTNDTNVTGTVSGNNLTLGWTGSLAVSRGGTGLATLPTNAILLGEGSSITTTAPGSVGQVLTSNGPGNDPSFQSPSTTATVLTQTFTAASTCTGVGAVCLSLGPITFDNKAFVHSVNTLSTSFTVGNNSNRVMVIFVQVGGGGGGNPVINSVTYNGSSATQIDSQVFGSVGYAYSFILVNPSTGSNTLVITPNGGYSILAAVYSYYNCNVSSQPDSHSSTTYSASVGSKSSSVVTSNDVAVVVNAGFSNGQGGGVPLTETSGFVNNTGSGTFLNGGSSWDYQEIYVGDTGTVTPAGSTSTGTVTLSNSSSNAAALFQIGLIPFSYSPAEIVPASASNAATANSFIGFSTGTINTGTSGSVYISGVVSGFSGLSPGVFYYLANSAGAISSIPGSITRKVGISLSSSTLLITNNW